MYNHISPKLAALAVALMMNGLILSGVAYVFNTQAQGPVALAAAHRGSAVTAVI